MRTAILGLAAVAGLLAYESSASAQGISIGYSNVGRHNSFGIGINTGPVYSGYGNYGYYQPYRPVYVQQAPVVVETVVAQPGVVYVQPSPVYVQTAPYYTPSIGIYGGYGGYRSYPYYGGYRRW